MTAVDSRGYFACEVVSLGRASPDTVIDLYERHCVDAACLCSDANAIYTQACDLLNLAHYIRPIARAHKIKNHSNMTHWTLAATIAKLDDIDAIIVDLVK